MRVGYPPTRARGAACGAIDLTDARSPHASSSIPKSLGVEIVQTVNREYLLHRLLEVIFEPDEVHLVLFDIHVAGAVVLVAGLADGADIAR